MHSRRSRSLRSPLCARRATRLADAENADGPVTPGSRDRRRRPGGANFESDNYGVTSHQGFRRKVFSGLVAGVARAGVEGFCAGFGVTGSARRHSVGGFVIAAFDRVPAWSCPVSGHRLCAAASASDRRRCRDVRSTMEVHRLQFFVVGGGAVEASGRGGRVACRAGRGEGDLRHGADRSRRGQ